MGKNMRYGPRFSGGSIEKVRGTGYIARFSHNETRAPRVDSLLGHCQKQSLKFRKKKGIEPSMPTFSFDKPKPEPPPPKIVFGPKEMAERILFGATMVEVLMEKGTQALVTMNYKGKEFTACIDTAKGTLMWTEGDVPYIRRNRELKRRDT